ncbi:RES family NAD+ phosphorylase [Uliginosibacterium gangwonense]|uniref:RES family NAD+ phosphorylase n=1 Tax=Uliginosibacterium gangwonense TaxID=392736 RepID=UPI00036ED2CC|nr:RES family NAD+ phosphorylase [Uliginosibacterium gangwonense]
MILWRIATETRQYPADDMSGGGAAASPGRWNDDKQYVIYAAPSLAIAVLETAAHLDDAGLPLNKYVVRIEVPDAVWAAREIVEAAALPQAWNAIPAGRASIDFGSDWLTSRRSPILVLPSVIVPEECVALINPQHPLAATISAQTVRLFEYNRLFRAR